MATFEITLLVLIIVSILAVGALSVPSEKGKQMHEQAKREDIQERTAHTTNHIIKKHTMEHSVLLMHR